MAFTTFDALVLREVRYKEADRILTLFTADRGILTAKARGALRKGSCLAAATQQLTFAEMTVFENKGRLTVQEAVIREPFAGLRKSFEAFSLGCYFAECVEALLPEGETDALSFQLVLNALYALSHGLFDARHIKAAFELRLMCLLGYAPDLSACIFCGKEAPEQPLLGLQTGHICCRACRRADVGITDELCDSSLKAMRYIVSAPAKQLFSFHLEKDPLNRLAECCEHYLTEQSGRRFATLDYWKRLQNQW